MKASTSGNPELEKKAGIQRVEGKRRGSEWDCNERLGGIGRGGERERARDGRGETVVGDSSSRKERNNIEKLRTFMYDNIYVLIATWLNASKKTRDSLKMVFD